jgi:purine-nucleoside phosphorylase
MDLYDRLQQTAGFLRHRLGFEPDVAVTLGSGLSFLGERLDGAISIDFSEIPNWPVSSVPGHSGRLVAGEWEGRKVALLCGRVHLYEGYTAQEVTFATRAVILAGAKAVVLTNAAGGVWREWTPGDIMLIRDHMNLQGTNVLCGPEDLRLGKRFIDMSDPYDGTVRARIRDWAEARGLVLREGVYAGLLGPSYETPAEVAMLRKGGADAVGMSTVQETIAARQLGATVVGLSVITNLAAGVSSQPLSHEEVKETAERVQNTFAEVIANVVQQV